MSHPDSKYASRGGLKLEAALDHFKLDPAGWTCADFGSNVGGFVDCLLQRGAAKVYALDTAYGVLDYRLRRTERVVVMERTNALHAELPEPVDLVTIDTGWTRQQHILPAAARATKTAGRVLTLVKPHYEAPPELLKAGVLDPEHIDSVLQKVRQIVRDLDWLIKGEYLCPVPGQAGNREVWLLLSRQGPV